jgi:hypothetical protein
MTMTANNDEWLASYRGEKKPNRAPSPPDENAGWEDDNCTVDSEPLIPPGRYALKYLDHSTRQSKNTGKLTIRFTIVEGECSGEIISAHYPVRLKGSAKRFGSFTASKQGKYFAEMCELFPDLANGRMDRISPRRLQGKKVIGQVKTVISDWEGKQRAPATQYSVVERLVGLC